MTLVLGLVLLAALGLLGLFFNHGLARLAFAEMALTNGLPTPTAEVNPSTPGRPSFRADVAAEKLPATAINLFTHSGCATCIRLVDELAADDINFATDVHVYFAGDRPSVPRGNTIEHEQEHELLDDLSIPATPYAVVTVDGQVAANDTVPNPRRLQSLIVMAGLSDRLPMRLLSDGFADGFVEDRRNS